MHVSLTEVLKDSKGSLAYRKKGYNRAAVLEDENILKGQLIEQEGFTNRKQ